MDNKKFLDLNGLRAYHNLVFEEISVVEANGHEYVDLGLPSGLLWATCNVGATSEEENGLYFQWGDTEGHAEGSGYSFYSNNYPQSDISTNLSVEQDAARSNWGGDWKMPINNDFVELVSNCHIEWTDDYNSTGKKGVIFYSCTKNTTGKGLYHSGSKWYSNNNGNYNVEVSQPSGFVPYTIDTPHVFFPASGYYLSTSLQSVGLSGFFWSASWKSNTVGPNMSLRNYSISTRGDSFRYYGQPVRGVIRHKMVPKLKPSLLPEEDIPTFDFDLDSFEPDETGLMGPLNNPVRFPIDIQVGPVKFNTIVGDVYGTINTVQHDGDSVVCMGLIVLEMTPLLFILSAEKNNETWDYYTTIRFEDAFMAYAGVVELGYQLDIIAESIPAKNSVTLKATEYDYFDVDDLNINGTGVIDLTIKTDSTPENDWVTSGLVSSSFLHTEGTVYSILTVGRNGITLIWILRYDNGVHVALLINPDQWIDTASTSKDGLMSSEDKKKLDGIAAGANNYSHPTYTSKSSGLYKITVNDTGHVSAATTVTKSDITALGIPAQDTQYTHPTYTSKSSGLYKITVDGTGHVSAATSVAKSDITALGIPSTDTTYSNATTSAAGLMSSDDKTKLNGIATGANAYTHPSYTAKSSGLYKVTVDSSGHVSAATAVTKTDITNLGIPSTNTTYSVATTSSNGLMSSTDKTTLNNLSTQVGNIQTALNTIING